MQLVDNWLSVHVLRALKSSQKLHLCFKTLGWPSQYYCKTSTWWGNVLVTTSCQPTSLVATD